MFETPTNYFFARVNDLMCVLLASAPKNQTRFGTV
jgi:hypothetical protein